MKSTLPKLRLDQGHRNALPFRWVCWALLLLLVSCNRHTIDSQYFQYANPGSDSVVDVRESDVQHLRANLYLYQDTLALGVQYATQEPSSDGESSSYKTRGILLFNTISHQLEIDTASYAWMIEGMIAKDKHHVYAFPLAPQMRGVEVLKLDPTTTILCDQTATYLKDNRFVYCIPNNTYLDVDPANFHTHEEDGVTYGTDSLHRYYWSDTLP